ncbi:MAG: flap endonuclease-1 [Thermoplasmatota archaeon]
MGVDLSELVPRQRCIIKDFAGQTIAIDAYNTIYQFLSIIRQPDGTPLMDSKRRVTSHLSGLLYRTINLIEAGVRPIYVFDGKPSELKRGTIEERAAIKERAREEWAEALAGGDLERARSKAQQTSRITPEMVEGAKRLLSLMGVPVVQAPSEGEAEASHMVRTGLASCVSSQDFDSLLFGSPALVRNLTITGRRKLPRKQIYVNIEPELIQLTGVLSSLGVTREQLVDMAILMGTDFNDGVRGIGPKKALKLIKEHGTLERALGAKGIEIPMWAEVRRIFLEPAVEDPGELRFGAPDVGGVVDMLCGEHDFSRDRVEGPLTRLADVLEQRRREGAQLRLDRWF